MIRSILPDHPQQREKVAQALATATLFFAGYGIGNMVATIGKIVV